MDGGGAGDAGWEELGRHISRSGRGNWEVLEMEWGGDACRGTGGDAQCPPRGKKELGTEVGD